MKIFIFSPIFRWKLAYFCTFWGSLDLSSILQAHTLLTFLHSDTAGRSRTTRSSFWRTMWTWCGVDIPVWRTTSTSRHWSQTTTTFCLINVSGRSTYSSVRCRWQSVSCCSRSSVEQSSIARHWCPILSPPSAVVLNHISSHFLIPLSDSSLICTVPVQWLVILDTIIVITFNVSHIISSGAITSYFWYQHKSPKTSHRPTLLITMYCTATVKMLAPERSCNRASTVS